MEKIPIRHIKESDFSGGFNIRDLEKLLSGKDMFQKLHRHNFFFVLVLEKGMGQHIIDFTPYPITDYAVFFMRPGQTHQLDLKKGSTGYLMEFDSTFYSPREQWGKRLLRKVGNKNYCQFDADKHKKLLTVLASIFQEHAEKQERYKEAIRASLEVFLIELARQSENPNGLSNNNKEYAQERLEELLELMETHISINKQVRQYADMLHLTTYQLNAITKETLGKTCSALINEHIILETKRCLLATSNQINQIAYQLGYEDVSYFIRFFKKQTGHSPEMFRKKFK